MSQQIHIGEMVKAQFQKRGCTVSWLARQLHCDRANIYNIFKRESLDTHRLYELCDILETNFFQLLSDAYGNKNDSVK